MSEAALSARPAASPAATPNRRVLVAGCPDGLDALHLVERLTSGSEREILYVGRDVARCTRMQGLVRVFGPGIETAFLPAWDCLPYDRVSPNGDIMARRLDALGALVTPAEAPRLVITSVNALVQRLPARATIEAGRFRARVGGRVDRDRLLDHLTRNGYRRAGTVVEPGEFAVRGGIVDVFPSGAANPLRLDLFGDVLENLRAFDPLSQRSLGRETTLDLRPVSEVTLDPAGVERFRVGYLQRFGAVHNDPLYDAVTAGRAFPGMEHWLPLFHEGLATLFDYLAADTPLALDHLAEEATQSRIKAIGEHYEARREAPPAGLGMGAAPYRPLPPEELYLDEHRIAAALRGRGALLLSPFAAPPAAPEGTAEVVDLGGRPARDFAPERTNREGRLFDAVVAHLRAEAAAGRRVVLAAGSAGSLDRLAGVVADHGGGVARAATWREAAGAGEPAVVVLPLDHGFVAGDLSVLAEQDILGDRLARPAKRRRKSSRFLEELNALSEGDIVVHADHGIGRFDGLMTLEIAGAPHDCLLLVYHGGDKLFVPVENLDVLTRYGASDSTVQLDKLGGLGWQTRKAKVKQRIQEIAGDLIRVAAERILRKAERLEPPAGLYDEFAAHFPFEETEDQDAAIGACLDDLASGHPMDRLICGDVGFGKTEVALRAAFVAAASGRQVALLAPTTLLVRQHFQVFAQRLRGFGLRVEQLSRFVPAKRAAEIKKDLAEGAVDVVIGTHALLGKGVAFKNLGLVIVDEEQHFGVAHKERLKQLRAEVHVLTLTATPIPRTLQMALGGLKDLSIIATPPVDRLAVRSFVMPSDPVVIREALLREHYRGGQSFYVTPRIEDQTKLIEGLRALVPELTIGLANGRMPIKALEDVMNAFYDRRLDVLVSTNIIESGLDIPTANTLIVHRADMFGLSQLYQLRGRVGRAKLRGYAYFTLPPNRLLGETAERRLTVIQGLESLGAGFQLASHDLDIRGSGNLLGSEQSGQVKEVGYELYNAMLEEAVEAAKSEATGGAAAPAGDWTPQITIDAAALIPESYISDLDLRLAMYRRLAGLREAEEVESFAAELIDRFGPLPEPTEQLLQLIGIKQLCRKAGVAKVEAGPKGVVVAFKDNAFERPERLVRFIAEAKTPIRLRPDHKLVLMRETASPRERLGEVRRLTDALVRLVA